MAPAKRCAWDELAALYQLVARGVLSYAPLVGILDAESLHSEDAAFQKLVLSGLGARGTAERTSLLVSRSHAGLQLPSVVEAAVASVSKDTLLLLIGVSPASFLARDSLREGMSQATSRRSPGSSRMPCGLLPATGYTCTLPPTARCPASWAHWRVGWIVALTRW